MRRNPSLSAHPPDPPCSARSPCTTYPPLLGDPGTVVSVDGASRGNCPARVRVDPGPHTIVFTFSPTGEARGQSITVKPGETVTMRSDFTGATPTIRIQR